MGIEYVGDGNDRSDYADIPGLSMLRTRVHNLTAATGGMAVPYEGAGHQFSMMGLITDDPNDLQSNFRAPKVTLHYGFTRLPLPDLFGQGNLASNTPMST